MKAVVAANMWHALNYLGLVLLAFYSVLVGVGYVTEGPRYQFKFDVHYPVYSTQRLLVGLGVRLTALMLRLARVLLSPLYEASAEVGEWVTRRSSQETQSRYRSRFL